MDLALGCRLGQKLTGRNKAKNGTIKTVRDKAAPAGHDSQQLPKASRECREKIDKGGGHLIR